MLTSERVTSIVQAVSGWAGLAQAPHRFGGVEFTLGKVEIGHIHRNGMVDIPFTRPIRDQLISEGKAEHHHLLADSGWVSYYVRSDADVEGAIWLFRVSYLQKTARRAPDLANAADTPLTPALRALIFKGDATGE